MQAFVIHITNIVFLNLLFEALVAFLPLLRIKPKHCLYDEFKRCFLGFKIDCRFGFQSSKDNVEVLVYFACTPVREPNNLAKRNRYELWNELVKLVHIEILR